MPETDRGSLVDSALTVAGYVGDDGRLAGVTIKTYRRWCARLEQWCRSRGRSHMPCTSETLAEWAEHLVTVAGYAASTADEALVAVRWQHRLSGESPPDRVAAWSVLRKLDPTRREPGSRLVRPACRDDLAAIAATSDPESGAAGMRDLVLALLPYGYGYGAEEMSAADIGVEFPPMCDRWHAGEMALICPTCAVRRWVAMLMWWRIDTGPLLRPVDRVGRPAGAVDYGGGGVQSGGRIRPARVRQMLRDITRRADLGESLTRRPVLALRVGGALEERDRGAELSELSRRIGYPPTSVMLARYLTLRP